MWYALFLVFGLAASLHGEEIDVVAEISKSNYELFFKYHGEDLWWDLGFDYDGDSISPMLRLSSEHILIGPLYGKGFYYTLYGENFTAWSASYSESTRWTLSDSRNVGMLLRYHPLSLWFLPRDMDNSLGVALDLSFLNMLSLYFAYLFIEVSAEDSGWYGGYESPDGVFSRLYFALRYAHKGWLVSTRYGVELGLLHPGGHELQWFLSRSGTFLDVNVLMVYRSPHFRAIPQGPEAGWYVSSNFDVRWGIFGFRTRLSYEKEIVLSGKVPEEDLLLLQRIEANIPYHEEGYMRFVTSFYINQWFRHYELDAELRADHDIKGLSIRGTLSASWDFDIGLLHQQRYGIDMRIGNDMQLFSGLVFSREKDWRFGVELGFRVEEGKWWCTMRIAHDELPLHAYTWRQFFAAMEYKITVGVTVMRIAQHVSPGSDVILDFYREKED